MTTLTTTPVRSHASPALETVYLNEYALQAAAAYGAIASERQTADDLLSALRAHTPPTEHDAIGLRFAILGAEMAAGIDHKHDRTPEAHRWAMIVAARALQDELMPRPAYVAAPQAETCRHGVAFKSTCKECDE